MNRVVAEWVEKAEGDYASALREFRARKNPNYDAACFFAQQCAEKYLKGLLQSRWLAFPKSHDLARLLDLCLPQHPEWELFREEFRLLTRYAVTFRYPGETASKEEAKHAIQIMTRAREMLQPLVHRRRTKK